MNINRGKHAFWNLSKPLSNLLGWAIHPDPEPLTDIWLGEIKNNVIDSINSVLREIESNPSQQHVDKLLKKTKRLAFEFATLLCGRPNLSTIPIEDWTVPTYQKLFDDLSELNDIFAGLSEEIGIAGDPVYRKFDTIDNAPVGDIVIHNHIEASSEQQTSDSHGNFSGLESQPKEFLTSWREITDALNMEYSGQSKVKSLNERYEGPIPNPGKGSQPIVEKSVLISWWNNLAILQQELSNQIKGKKLSAESSHKYGRSGEVVPEISGEIKKRRSDKKT